MKVSVRIKPAASRDEVLGCYEFSDITALKIAIHSPAIDGKANSALTKYLAKLLKVKAREIIVVSGEKSRTKILEIPNHCAALWDELLASGANKTSK